MNHYLQRYSFCWLTDYCMYSSRNDTSPNWFRSPNNSPLYLQSENRFFSFSSFFFFFLAWSGMVSLKNLHEERPDLLYIGLIWQGPETELLLPTTELQKFWTHESHETRCASTNLINPCCSDHQNPYLLGLLVFDLSSTLRYLVGRFCEGNDW